MESTHSVGSPSPTADRAAGPVQRAGEGRLDLPAREGRGDARPPSRPYPGPSAGQDLRAQRRSLLVEEFRAHQQRQARRQAARAAAPAPQAPPARDESIARQQRLTRDLVHTLARHRPPSEARRIAADQARDLRESRQQRLQHSVEHQRARRSVLQERAEAAYREAAGLSPDAALGSGS